MKMDIRPLKTKDDYDRALVEIEAYFGTPPALGTPAAERFDVLAALSELYEARHWPIDPPDTVVAVNHARRSPFIPARIDNNPWAPRV